MDGLQVWLSSHVQIAKQGWEKKEQPTLHDGGCNVMVLEILSHSGQVNHRVDSEFSQLS